jgi:hypothetical protein
VDEPTDPLGLFVACAEVVWAFFKEELTKQLVVCLGAAAATGTSAGPVWVVVDMRIVW